MKEILYTVNLTGSRFFDTVIYTRAKDLTRGFDGVEVIVDPGKTITIRGSLPKEAAEQLHAELGYYSAEK